jgi:biotin synthase
MVKEISISELDKNKFDDILNKALHGGNLTKREIARLLSTTDSDDIRALFLAADDVREKFVGDEVHLRGIVEFSNFCKKNCHYCGLRWDNHKISRYRMSEDEVLASAHHIRKLHIPTIVLQSGEDDYFHQDRLCHLIKRISEETGLIITLSVGERSYDDFRAFRKAGADRYLLKHETASAEIQTALRPESSFEKRLACLKWLKELGYEVGTGVMVGLPLQNESSLSEDILLMKQIDADMIGIGPFIAHPETPLANQPNGDVDMVLKMIAVTRIVTKSTNIPATTALGTLNPRKRMEAFSVGANVLMPDFTSARYRQFYDIYPGKTENAGDPGAVLHHFESEIRKIGRIIGKTGGYRKHD